MIIGIDGNMWYCSNGRCLGDPRSVYSFERTLRAACDSFAKQIKEPPDLPAGMAQYADKTPEQYLELARMGPNDLIQPRR